MSIDYLSLMGVQRWQLKSSFIDKDTNSIDKDTNFQTITVSKATLERKLILKEKVINEVAVDQQKNKIENTLFVYACTSIRENQRWLWLVNQTSLSIEELRLLDKIVVATQSRWEEMGIADNYLDFEALKQYKQQPLSAVILIGANAFNDSSNTDSSSQLLLDLFKGENILTSPELKTLIDAPEKKRYLWNDLQKLISS